MPIFISNKMFFFFATSQSITFWLLRCCKLRIDNDIRKC